MVLLCCWPQIIKFFVVVLISFSSLYFFTLVTDLLSLTFHALFWSANIPYCLHHQDNSNCGFAGGASFCPSPTVIQMWPLADVGRAGDQEIKGTWWVPWAACHVLARQLLLESTQCPLVSPWDGNTSGGPFCLNTCELTVLAELLLHSAKLWQVGQL